MAGVLDPGFFFDLTTSMRSSRLIPALCLCAAVTLPQLLCASLKFEASEITLKPALGEKQLTAEFKFTNTGDAPTTITRVHSSCGCTVPEKPAEPIAPGGTGVIPVIYKPGERQGRQMQSIQVETADGKAHDLRLVVDIPVRVSIAPRLLLFRGSDEAVKITTLTFSSDDQTGLLNVSSQSPAFEVMGEPKLEDGVLKLSIRHIGEATAEARGTVRVRTRGRSGVEHTDVIYVRHMP